MTQHTTIDCHAADVTVLPAGRTSNLSRVWAHLRGFLKAIRHRMKVRELSAFDDRMLKDIGLTRADVHDALSAPLSADPSEILADRVRERRFAHRHLLRLWL